MIARTAEDLEVDKRIVPEELITRDRKGPRTEGITFQSEEIIRGVALEKCVVMRDQVLHPVGPTGTSINGISHPRLVITQKQGQCIRTEMLQLVDRVPQFGEGSVFLAAAQKEESTCQEFPRSSERQSVVGPPMYLLPTSVNSTVRRYDIEVADVLIRVRQTEIVYRTGTGSGLQVNCIPTGNERRIRIQHMKGRIADGVFALGEKCKGSKH